MGKAKAVRKPRDIQKGSRTYPIPYHKGKELGKGLENKMKKDMGLK